jgi:hypothetical protein
MVLGRESGHDVIPSQHFCVRMCIVYLCFQYTLRRFLVPSTSTLRIDLAKAYCSKKAPPSLAVALAAHVHVN